MQSNKIEKQFRLQHRIESIVKQLSDVFLSLFRESVSTDGNTTTSVLNLMPTYTDDNALLICRAQNVRLSHQYIEDGWELQVYCKCGAHHKW